MMPLHGKTALVTGSTDGVGRVVANRLAEAGAHVLIHGRDQPRGERVVAPSKRPAGQRNF
jgi:NAD(P)-dependent dehydrogenase (short-subunit alcohol dehydrogenase family)